MINVMTGTDSFGPKQKNVLRLSYSLLRLWELGRIDEAVAMYSDKKRSPTIAMEEGLLFHKRWEKEMHKTQTVTMGKTVYDFKKDETITGFFTEDVIGTFINGWQLKGICDGVVLRENPHTASLVEYKTGVTPVAEYARTMQIPLYFLITETAYTVPVTHAHILHFNQKTGESESIKIWNSKELVQKAENYVLTLGPEIEEYFNRIGLCNTTHIEIP